MFWRSRIMQKLSLCINWFVYRMWKSILVYKILKVIKKKWKMNLKNWVSWKSALLLWILSCREMKSLSFQKYYSYPFSYTNRIPFFWLIKHTATLRNSAETEKWQLGIVSIRSMDTIDRSSIASVRRGLPLSARHNCTHHRATMEI